MFKKILEPQKKLIVENYTLGEFTFGFELEAYFKDAERNDVERWALNYWDEAKVDLNIKDPSTKKTNPIETKGMEFKNDGSISVDEYVSSTCQDCGGEGEVTCNTCHGRGSVECEECDTSGRIDIPCPECDGHGEVEDEDAGEKITCYNCDGNGEVDVDCENCDGEGEISCHNCGGDGNERCYNCNGSGEVEASSDDISYEFASPVMTFNPNNLSKVIKFLTEGIRNGFINTNESCGFHVHIGFPNKYSRSEDIFWVLSHMVLDDGGKKFEEISHLEDIRLFTQDSYDDYASLSFLENLAYHYSMLPEKIKYYQSAFDKSNVIDAETYEEDFFFEAKKVSTKTEKEAELIKKEFSKIVQTFYTDEKYSSFRQHPQGTLEWRGPRTFMDDGNIAFIKKFFIQKLHPLVKWISDTLSKNYLDFDNTGGLRISRQAFDLVVKEHKSPAKRVIDNKNRKFDTSVPKELVDSFVKQYPKFIKNYNITNLKIYKADGRLNVVDGEIFPKKEKELLIDFPMRFSVIKNLIISLQDELDATTSCTFEDCIIKYMKASIRDRFYKCSLHGGDFRGPMIEESTIHNSKITDANIYTSLIHSGEFNECNIRYGVEIAKDVEFDKCYFINNFKIEGIKSKIFATDCSFNFSLEETYKKGQIFLNGQTKMQSMSYQHVVFSSKEMADLGDVLSNYPGNTQDPIKEGDNLAKYITKAARL